MGEDLEKLVSSFFMRLQLDKEFDELSSEIQVRLQRRHKRLKGFM